QGQRAAAEDTVLTTGDGVFRFLELPPGRYSLTLTREGLRPVNQQGIEIAPSQFYTVQLTMASTGANVAPAPAPEPATQHGRLPNRGTGPDERLPEGKMFMPPNDRWALPLPIWDRYNRGGDFPYVAKHWYDPYNTNVLKGDEPVFGKRTFFTFTGV